jgi:hypothetical protein
LSAEYRLVSSIAHGVQSECIAVAIYAMRQATADRNVCPPEGCFVSKRTVNNRWRFVSKRRARIVLCRAGDRILFILQLIFPERGGQTFLSAVVRLALSIAHGNQSECIAVAIYAIRQASADRNVCPPGALARPLAAGPLAGVGPRESFDDDVRLRCAHARLLDEVFR